MRSFYAQFTPFQSSASLRRAIVLSIVLHVAIVAVLTVRLPREYHLAQAGMYSVELINPNAPPAEAPPLGQPDAKPPESPKPAPPPPPPKQEEPKPKAPEPKNEAPKLVKEEKPKPEKPKEEKPKKETPKAERKKEEEKKEPEKKPLKIARNDNPLQDLADNPLDDLNAIKQPTRPTKQQPQIVPGVSSGKPGLAMAGGIPSALGMWGGLVQRKVEKEWEIPEGIQLGSPDDGALISFWVGRNGELLGEPEIVKHAVDPAVATSAIRAIKAVVPYPALPDSYGDAKVQVYYTFIPMK